jgi:hypothetical protein
MKPETTLLRQVHPNFIQEGQLTSQAFVPSANDAGKLSVYDNDQISAAQSYQHYTAVMHNKSHGVWGVTCAEVSDTGLSSAPDAKDDSPSHAVIDFTAHPERDFRKFAKKLKAFAVARGCLFSQA